MSKIDNLIQKLNQDLIIEDVISTYIPIEKKGTNYWAICPFHEDTKPSLSISPTKKIFKCFSCGVGGNAFNFIQKYNNVSFLEAVKIASKMYNINYEQYIDIKEKSFSKIEKDLFKINGDTLNYFKFQLELERKKDTPIASFLKQRKITEEDIDKYQLGFNSKNKIINYLISKKYSYKDINDSKIGTNGQSILQERLIFPIFNEDGFVEGFSGRDISNNPKISKYINSSQTEVFQKNDSLWNIQNLGYSEQEIAIFEGFFDVIGWEKNSNSKIKAVATMGTAFNKKLINKLKRRTKNLIIGFDNDQAGIETKINFAFAILENLSQNEVLNIKILDFDLKYKDIDEFFNAKQFNYNLKEFYIWFIDDYLIKIKDINNVTNHNLLPINHIQKFLSLYQNKSFYDVVENYFKSKIILHSMFLNLSKNYNQNYFLNQSSVSNPKTNEINWEKLKIKKKDLTDILNIKEKYFFENLSKLSILKREDVLKLLDEYAFSNPKLQKQKDKLIEILINGDLYKNFVDKNSFSVDVLNEKKYSDLTKEIEEDLYSLKTEISQLDFLIEMKESSKLNTISYGRLKKINKR